MTVPNWVYKKQMDQMAAQQWEENWLLRKQIRELHEEIKEILKDKP
jgi:hypothetical protein